MDASAGRAGWIVIVVALLAGCSTVSFDTAAHCTIEDISLGSVSILRRFDCRAVPQAQE